MAGQLLAAACAVLLAACATMNEAPVRDRSSGAPPQARPRVEPSRSFDSHAVASGDTLYAIAFRHGLDYRALAAWNRIDPPFTIQSGKRLRLTAPEPPRIERIEPPRMAAADPAPATPPSTTAPMWAAEPPTAGQAQTFGIDSGAAAAPALRVEPADGGAAAVNELPPAISRADRMDSARPRTSAPVVAVQRSASPSTGPLSSAIATPRTATSTSAAEGTASASRVLPPQAIAPTAAATAELPAAAPGAIPTGPTQAVGGVTWRWPADGAVIVRFAPGDPARQGIDIRGRDGAPVRAAADGEVVYSGSGLVGYGELIIVKHSAEYLSAYGYNRRRLVEEGRRVRAGQQIAEMGKANANLDVLHFEIRRSGKPIDPLQVLPRR